jgi:tetratricopeptide (TPR) repeat protein
LVQPEKENQIMKTLLIFILLISSTTAVSAQTARRFFDNGTKAANAGQFQQAIEHYQRALDNLEANDASDLTAKAHFNIGVCHFRLNQPEKAIREYEQAIKLSGINHPQAFYALGMAHVELKNRRAAKAALTTAIQLSARRDGEAWFDLAMILIEEKDFSAAAEAFKQAIKNKTTASAASHNNLGVILALNGDFKAAEKEFELALDTSKGKFIKAKSNLEFCRSKQPASNLVAKLEFAQ